MSTQQLNDSDFAYNFYLEAKKIPLDGHGMVKDIHHLCGLKKRELPLEINHDWHPAVGDVYKKIISGDVELPEHGQTAGVPDGTQFFIYERDPIDDWQGYRIISMGDIFHYPKWRYLIFHSLNILKLHSYWEGDIREGPFVSMLPGEEWDFAHWVVLLKQDNNGTTFVVSNYKLEYLDEYFVKLVTAGKDGVSK